jgi:hypothetical protein
MSAPASLNFCARSIAASKPSVAAASVRAMTSRSRSVRASTAALILSTASSVEITSLPEKWPQRLGATWSSNWMQSAPARSSTRTVWRTFSALPKPVSASTISGRPTASRMRAVWSAISCRPMKPWSGRPNHMLVTPAPVT